MQRENFTGLILECDSAELNPLLEPDRNAHLKVIGIKGNEKVVISPEMVRFNVNTLLTCGAFDVISVDNNGTVTAINGGYAQITASYVGVGHGLTASIKIIVRPFFHEYHKTLTFKLCLGMEPWGSLRCAAEPVRDSSVYIDIDEALDIIKRLDRITAGMSKILYLVGWQRGGHDHGYPDLSTPNPKLKRPGDKDARESIRWLIRQGKLYNTDVSFHLNLIDAYNDSPLWDEYKANHIFVENDDGSLQIAGGGFTAIVEKYNIMVTNVVQTRLWNSGFFKKRLDELLTAFPEIIGTHTIHIDNWRTIPCPAMGITKRDEEDTLRKMYLYLRSVGLDTTSEGSFHGRDEPMTGLQPMTWWDIPYHPLIMPPSLYCGGRAKRVDSDPRFGDTIQIEASVGENLRRGDDLLLGIQDEFCIYTLPWQYLNNFRLESFDGNTAVYNNHVRAFIEDGIPVIYQGDTRIRCGTTLFVPLGWQEKTAITYSYRDTYMVVNLPADWDEPKHLEFYYMNRLGRSDSLSEKVEYILTGRELRMLLNGRCAYIVKPVY